MASGLLHKVQHSGLTSAYLGKVPGDELQQRVYEIYRHLGDWLLGKTEVDIEKRYREIGACRANQGVPLQELVWALVLTKENLWDFLKREAVLDRAVEVFGELEMLQLLDQFFDRAIYYAAAGYEQALALHHAAHTAGVR